MHQDLVDGGSFAGVSLEHAREQVQALVGDLELRWSKAATDSHVGACERYFTKEHCVQKDAQGPDLGWFGSVRLAGQDLGRSKGNSAVELVEIDSPVVHTPVTRKNNG